MEKGFKKDFLNLNEIKVIKEDINIKDKNKDNKYGNDNNI